MRSTCAVGLCAECVDGEGEADSEVDREDEPHAAHGRRREFLHAQMSNEGLVYRRIEYVNAFTDALFPNRNARIRLVQ